MILRRVYLLIFILILVPAFLDAQVYEHAAGVRAGYSSGFTYKGFLKHSTGAVEIDAYYNNHGLNLTALYAQHYVPFRSKRWMIYAGGGLFGGEWEEELSLGISAVGGIEFVVRDLPLNFGLDWKPMLNVYRIYGIDLLDFGISLRYRFKL